MLRAVEVQFGGSTYFLETEVGRVEQTTKRYRGTLTRRERAVTLAEMEVRFKPETESRLKELASKSGRPANELVEDAMAAYLSEVSGLRARLDGRYEEVKNGTTKLIDGEAFFDGIHRVR